MDDAMWTAFEARAELARVKRFELVELPTGHWPMFTKPVELATLVAAALPEL
jgi:pimeloyl-ACP methyl ester carboxylesterase